MRFIFQLLLGMILFNAMLFIFAPYFPVHTVSGIDVVNSSSFTDYKSLNIQGLLTGFFTYFISSFFITLFVARLVSGGNIPTGQLLGACLVVSIFVGLWSTLTSPLVGIAGSYPSIAPFYSIFSVVLGVVVMISVVEIFTGKGDETS